MDANGRITGVEEKHFTKDGEDRVRYSYKIGNRFYSGFKKLEEYNVKVGDYCIVSYNEKPNPQSADKPFKNIVNITQAKEPEGSVGEPTTHKPEAEHTLGTKRSYDYNEGAFFGMIFNKTVDWIIQERASNKLREGSEEVFFDKLFGPTFDNFWNKALAKRKEKLE